MPARLCSSCLIKRRLLRLRRRQVGRLLLFLLLLAPAALLTDGGRPHVLRGLGGCHLSRKVLRCSNPPLHARSQPSHKIPATDPLRGPSARLLPDRKGVQMQQRRHRGTGGLGWASL